MIVTDEDFLTAIEQKSFINDISVQESMLWHAFKKPSIKTLDLLWLIQQNYNVVFTHKLLEASYIQHASVDDLLNALSTFIFKPKTFAERILEEGNSSQIKRLHVILKELAYE